VIDLSDDAERDALAAEYVLGTLDTDDHAAVAAALGSHSALRAAVYAWQDRLLSLSSHATASAPSPALWPRIERSVPAKAHVGATTAPVPRRAAPTLPWWQRLSWWQGLSAAALAASVVLSVLLLQRPDSDAGPRYVAVLQSPDSQSTGWVVELRGDRLRLVPTAAATAPPPGRSLQFWTKAQSATAPTSLGLVQAGQTVELPLSRLPAVEAQQLFEITLEPEGGSTVGRPTGPILFVGRTVAL
jgi:anti-sigma-K factor RskA